MNNIVDVYVAKQFITIENDTNRVAIATYVFSALLASQCLFNSKLFCWLIYIVLPVASYMHIRTYVITYIHIIILIGITDLELMGLFDCSTNETNVIITWTNATSLYCREVLYYIVQLLSDNINIDDRNVTDLSSLTVTFCNLSNNANYEVAVTAGNRVGVGMTITKNITTFPLVPSQPPTNSTNDTGGHVYITIGLQCTCSYIAIYVYYL